MRRALTILVILAAAGLAAGSPVHAATAKPKTAAKSKAAPKPSAKTIAWGKAQCNKADKLLANGDYEKARDIYSQVLWKLPASPRAKSGLKKADAAIRAKQNKEREAAQKAAKAGAARAKERMEIDQKLKAKAEGLLDGDPPTIAQRLVDLLSNGEYAAVTSTFDDTMKASLPAPALEKVWKDIVAANGPFQEMTTVRTADEAGYDCVYVTCRFERSTFDAKVVFNSDKRVSGFFLLKPQ